MRIALLSRDGSLYSCQRLIEAARQRQHEIEVINPLACRLYLETRCAQIYHQNALLPQFCAVIPRIGIDQAEYALAILRQFELLQSYSCNGSHAIMQARNKLSALQCLIEQNIPVPQTSFVFDPQELAQSIEQVRGVPVVMKPLQGSQGIGVLLAQNMQATKTAWQEASKKNKSMLIQEFIQESKGEDIRCFVVGHRVVAAMQRCAKAGDFRSNLHCGGVATRVKLTAEERALAIRATRCLGLNIAGVDLLRSHRGPLVLEVNASPGLEGIEKISGIDVAGMIIEFMELALKLRKLK